MEYQGDGNKAIFYYIADERVDFRQLIKVLAEAFHVRIEMKQIGARQEAGRIGGTGPCGRELCCATWMKNFISVSTNAARFQDISLNPQKLAGMCAKLKCCLNYEVDNYMEAGKRLPSKDIVLQTLDADYYLFKTDILAGLVTYSTDKRTAANLEVITVDRAKDIIEMNKQGEKPMSLQEDGRQKGDDKTKDLLEGESITRFDKNKKKKKRKSKADKNAKTEVATEQAGKQDVNVEKQKPAGNNVAKDEQAGESKVKDQASAQMGESVADAKKMRKAQANRRAFKKTKPAGNSQEGGAQTTSDQQGRNEQNPGQQQ